MIVITGTKYVVNIAVIFFQDQCIILWTNIYYIDVQQSLILFDEK